MPVHLLENSRCIAATSIKSQSGALQLSFGDLHETPATIEIELWTHYLNAYCFFCLSQLYFKPSAPYSSLCTSGTGSVVSIKPNESAAPLHFLGKSFHIYVTSYHLPLAAVADTEDLQRTC